MPRTRCVTVPAENNTHKHVTSWSIRVVRQVVGRLAQSVARLLQGKHKPLYAPGVDCGDFVVVVNAHQARFTGAKLTDKIYYRHTGYMGGIRQRTARELLERKPTDVLEKAVKGMLPKNRLARDLMTRLRLFADEDYRKHIANVKFSEAHCGAFLEASRPPSTARLESERIDADKPEPDLLRSIFPVDKPGSWDVERIEREADKEPAFAELEAAFAATWAAEIEFWKERSTVVPEDLYDAHGLPFPGKDAPPLPAAEAGRLVAAAARKHWETVGKKTQQQAIADLKELVSSDGAVWRGKERDLSRR